MPKQDDFAFPNSNPLSRGMSLRDYFAAQALAGLLANEQSMVTHQSFDADLVSVRCYLIADAMLAARTLERCDRI